MNGLHTELSCENGLKDVVQIAIGSFEVNKTDKTNNLYVDPVLNFSLFSRLWVSYKIREC